MKVVRNFEEEERQKKLSDTANKLLRKIKPWSAEVDFSKTTVNLKNDSGQGKSTEKKSLDRSRITSGNNSIKRQVDAFKPKRLAHSNPVNKVFKKQVPKSNFQSHKAQTKSSKYDVNKATVKDFQSRIQHKLINEIMQMPKENLQNVLNDPKINPIMELKMSRLVRENKLLIAEKLRALAESKMTSGDSVSNSQLLVDIDKLIDPVIETDLSVLPYELIKQMENIFQVQFDYSNIEGDNKSTSCESLLNEGCNETVVQSSDCPAQTCVLDEQETSTASSYPSSSFNQVCNVDIVKSENSTCDDFGVYDCSTDEDEDDRVSGNKDNESDINRRASLEAERTIHPDPIVESDINHRASLESERTVHSDSIVENIIKKVNNKRTVNESSESTKKLKLCEKVVNFPRNPQRERPNQKRSKKSLPFTKQVSLLKVNNFPQEKQHNDTPLIRTCPSTITSNCESIVKSVSNSEMTHMSELLSKSCQTYFFTKTVGTQTDNEEVQGTQGDLNPPPLLQEDSLPVNSSEESAAALLQEVNSIQAFINKLNERRFAIFLHLARTDPCGNFIQNKFTCDNFSETVTNGSVSMIESLTSFFIRQQNNCNRNWSPGKHKHSKKKGKQWKKQGGGNQS